MTVVRLIFSSSSNYKIYYTDDSRLHKSFSTGIQNQAPIPNKILSPNKNKEAITVMEMDAKCPKCGKVHKIKGYPDLTSAGIKAKKLETNNNIDENDVLVCDNCKFALDLKPVKNQIEQQTRRKISFK